MPDNNNLSITLSEADVKKINDALAVIESVLNPVLITLTKKQISRLPKASDKSLPFIQQALELAEQHPAVAPGYVDLPELKRDLAAWQQVNSVQRRLQPLASNLASTGIKLGSEAYVTALAFYNSAQQAAKRNVSGAQDILDVLEVRFASMGTAATPAAK